VPAHLALRVVLLEPGVYELRWITGKVAGYGFHTARNDRAGLDDAALVAAIRSLLGQVDPETGLIDWSGPRHGGSPSASSKV
jgi:hypothetical protein